MKLEKIPHSTPSGEVVDVSSTEDIGNYSPEQADAEANEIVNNLPGSLDSFSTEQQDLFIKIVGPQVDKIINIDRNNPESVPNVLPENTVNRVNRYKEIRNPENFSRLPIDKQEALKKAEKDAISKIKQETEALKPNTENSIDGPEDPKTIPGQDGGNTGKPGIDDSNGLD